MAGYGLSYTTDGTRITGIFESPPFPMPLEAWVGLSWALVNYGPEYTQLLSPEVAEKINTIYADHIDDNPDVEDLDKWLLVYARGAEEVEDAEYTDEYVYVPLGEYPTQQVKDLLSGQNMAYQMLEGIGKKPTTGYFRSAYFDNSIVKINRRVLPVYRPKNK